MLCVTGKETSNQSLKQRIERTKARVKDCLQEVRLDALTHINDDTFSILHEFPKDLIVCCRPERQGGWFKDSEEDRLQILDRAARTGVAYLDVEADVPDSRLKQLSRQGGTKQILSWHDFKCIPDELGTKLKEMSERGTAVVKSGRNRR